MFHDYVKGRSGDLFNFYQVKKDPYPILVAFGVICGTFWIATGAIVGFVSRKVYLLCGIITTVIFTVVFTCIYERVKDGQPCTLYSIFQGGADPFAAKGCKTDGNWEQRHVNDSYDFFWGSSLAAFILATYQLVCASALLYEEMTQGSQPIAEQGAKPHPAQPVPAAPTTTTAPVSKPAPPTTVKHVESKPVPVITTAPKVEEKKQPPMTGTATPAAPAHVPEAKKAAPAPTPAPEVKKESPKTSAPLVKPAESVLVEKGGKPPAKEDDFDFDDLLLELGAPPEDSPIPSMFVKNSTFGPPPM